MNKTIFFFLLGITSVFAQNKHLFAEYSIGETSSANNTFISLKASQTFGIGYGIQHNDSLNWVKQSVCYLRPNSCPLTSTKLFSN